MGTSLAVAAVAQAPSSLADRIKQLRRDWSESDAEPEPELADEYVQVAPPREGSAQSSAAANGRSGVPQIDGRSLMPQNLFGRSDTGSSSDKQLSSTQRPQPRQLSSPSAVTNRPVARKSPTTAPPTAQSPSYSTARRSPTQRTYVDVNPDALHDELAGTNHAPAAIKPQDTSTEPSPNILDDFAAGLSKSPTTPSTAKTAATPSSTPTTTPTSSPTKSLFAAPSTSKPVTSKPSTSQAVTGVPINLPSTPEPRYATPEPVAAGVKSKTVEPEPAVIDAEPTPATSDDRYAQPSIPSVGKLQGRSTIPNSASGRALVGRPEASTEAEKAFQFDSIPMPEAAPKPTPTRSNTVSNVPVAPRGSMTGDAADARRESFIKEDQDSGAGPGVLVSNVAPALMSDIRGPKQIAIGREAAYRVRLQNQGGSSAEAVVATVRIPSWAEVVNATASNGVVRQIAADDSAATLQWQIPHLDAQSAETLNIDLVPRASRPLELAVSWTHDPVNTRTVVEVQEPKLKLEVTGPDEVLFNKSHVYRLTLSNPGTGVAENVRINLLPPGGGDQAVSTFEVGDLAPGVSKTAEVELTAREAGKLSVQAVAIAEGDLKSEAVKELFCRKPELEVDWRGPDTQYAGTAATYFFRVRNPGTAAADDVAVKVNLPAGAEFVSASEGHVYDSAKREIAWRVGSLGPGDDCYMELRCSVSQPGENKLSVHAATAAGDLVDNKTGVTNVVAIADLKLDVSDPSGPIAVGQDAIYEIRVTNRGASAAEEVNVIALFSAGLEPETGEGAPYTVSDGRVAFRTINKLPAGQDIVLQIRAKATEAGTHVFRAEVLCRDLEIKLAAEETTRFYLDDLSHDKQATPPATVGASYEAAAH
jgi:uncharacterized repeat protein (TIGR01451 family)